MNFRIVQKSSPLSRPLLTFFAAPKVDERSSKNWKTQKLQKCIGGVAKKWNQKIEVSKTEDFLIVYVGRRGGGPRGGIGFYRCDFKSVQTASTRRPFFRGGKNARQAEVSYWCGKSLVLTTKTMATYPTQPTQTISPTRRRLSSEHDTKQKTTSKRQRFGGSGLVARWWTYGKVDL